MADNKNKSLESKSLKDIESFLEQTKTLLEDDEKILAAMAQSERQDCFVDSKTRLQDLVKKAAFGLPGAEGHLPKTGVAGINRMAGQLSQVKCDLPTEKDNAAAYSAFDLVGMNLAVRKDGLRVYLKYDPAILVDIDQLTEFFKTFSIKEINSQALEAAQKGGVVEQWILVAEGKKPIPGEPESLELLNPRKSEQVVRAKILNQISLELYDYFQQAGGDHTLPVKIRALAVAPGETVARILSAKDGEPGLDVFGEEIPPPAHPAIALPRPGPHVTLKEQQFYIAERYGYVSLINKRLSIVSPLRVDSQKIHAYWIILGRQPEALQFAMVKPWLGDEKIVSGILRERINELASSTSKGSPEQGEFLVAEGSLPINGKDSTVEILVDQKARAGLEREDGSIDFRQMNFVPNVLAGEIVARHNPPTLGVVGKNLLGKKLKAVDGIRLLTVGENIEVKEEDGVELYCATIDGMFSQTGTKISVLHHLPLEGDINYRTGNIDFAGEVFVNGSVKTGFSVKATGNITIANGVEFGAEVVSLGDIIVGEGIVGKDTRVIAQGSVRAQFIHEATAIAQKDVMVGNSSYHAYVRAGDMVKVEKSKGSRGGSIIGGQTWALTGIDVHFAGSYSGTQATLVVGVDPEQVNKIEKLERSIEECNHHIMLIMQRLGLSQLDVDEIKEIVAAASGDKRQTILQQISLLEKLGQTYQMMLQDRRNVQKEMEVVSLKATIKVRNMAYAGVMIRIGNCQRRLHDDVRMPTFSQENGKLVES